MTTQARLQGFKPDINLSTEKGKQILSSTANPEAIFNNAWERKRVLSNGVTLGMSITLEDRPVIQSSWLTQNELSSCVCVCLFGV